MKIFSSNVKKSVIIGLFPLVLFLPFLSISFLEKDSFNSSSSPQEIDSLYSIKEVSLGEYHSGAVVNNKSTKNDDLYTWGSNGWGQLGNGGGIPCNTPQKIEIPFISFDSTSTNDIKSISLGTGHTAAVVENQGSEELYTWGLNANGQVGNNDEKFGTEDRPQEIMFPETDDEKQFGSISMGNTSSAAVIGNDQEDDLYTWGKNDYGELAQPATDQNDGHYIVPTKVDNLPSGNIEQVSLGYRHSAAVVNDGGSDHLYTWGNNNKNQLGRKLDDGSSFTNVPGEVVFEEPSKDSNIEIEQISLGDNYSAAITNDEDGDHLYTWGDNSKGQLGLGYKGFNEADPHEVDLLPKGDIEQISMRYATSSAVVNFKDEDHLYTWGDNSSGQLGLGDNYNNDYYGAPQEVAFLPKGDIEQISIGGIGVAEFGKLDKQIHSSAIVKDENSNSEALYTWGNNRNYQLGLGDDFTEDFYNTPQLVWETPYLINESSSVNSDLSKRKEAELTYSFETSLDVQNVTINLMDETGAPVMGPITSIPKSNYYDHNLYTGNTTFSNLNNGQNYFYTIELNYLNYSGEVGEPITISENSSFQYIFVKAPWAKHKWLISSVLLLLLTIVVIIVEAMSAISNKRKLPSKRKNNYWKKQTPSKIISKRIKIIKKSILKVEKQTKILANPNKWRIKLRNLKWWFFVFIFN